jgi:hypothetical protein
MTQFTPPPPPPFRLDYGYGNAPRRGNAWAVASLVLGLLGCVPFITGVLAIVFGALGIRKTRDPSAGGQGLAIAGLILGIISVVGWTGFAGLLGYGYQHSKPAQIVARQFLQDVAAGNVAAAAANSTGLTTAQLQAQTTQMIPFGTLKSVNFSTFNVSMNNGQTTVHLGGTAAFSNGPRTCTFDLANTGAIYRVTAYSVQ